MDPYEAAKAAVEKCDGLSFMGRTLRVDFASGQISGGLAGASGIPGQFDSRRTVFVGGLDFQIKEEDLRAFFEKLVATERGDVDGSGEDDDDDESMGEGHDAPASSSNYVSHVRIVRDKDTQLGKGIAYVEFKVRKIFQSYHSTK
jgi:nucleolar protein 12